MLDFSVAYKMIMKINLRYQEGFFKNCEINTYCENEYLCHFTHFEEKVGKYIVIESLSCTNANSLTNFAGGIFHPYVRVEIW